MKATVIFYEEEKDASDAKLSAMSTDLNAATDAFASLVKIMERLRSPEGCPWDRKQSFDTLKTYLLEETYEVMDAIDRRHWTDLAEELGDLLLQPIFLAQMAAEQGLFTIGDSLEAINEKLIRRHPHIFGEEKAQTAEQVKARWDEIKREEKARKGKEAESSSELDGVLRSLPALVEAFKISKKAASLGFEWPNIGGVIDKLREEAEELVEARNERGPAEVEHEVGDILFTLVNLARFLEVDPEQALRKANERFRKRFRYVEQQLSNRGSSPQTASLERMEALWQEGKTKVG